MFKFNFLLIFLIFFFSGCTKKNNENISLIKQNSQELEMISAYNKAYESLNNGDPYFASKKFLEAELLYPQSEWAAKSALMASYSFYQQNYYVEAISNLNRFIDTYPKNKDMIYAHYLLAICYYEMIEDEKRDTEPLINAKQKFNFIVTNYPNSEFEIDSRFKLDLIEDILASKEMYLGRHYAKKKKWIAAMNRFKIVVTDYNRTVFIEEALHRLVEINYKLGLIEESKKYAKILGYNYLSSEWYKKSYKIFNKDYSTISQNEIKKDKRGVVKKFKKLFE
jgi:outer membrane protein assembly factor BamD